MVLLLERDGVVGKELWSVFKHLRDSVLWDIDVYRTQHIGEHKGDVIGWGLREDGGQNGKCMVGAGGDAWDGTIGEYEDSSDGIDVLLDLGCNSFLLELGLLKIMGVGQSRGVEETNIGKRLCAITVPINSGTYHYAVLARKFINAGGVSLVLVGRTTLLVGMVDDVKLITSSVISGNNIGN